MADWHCEKCGEDASYDARWSGCGDPRCCTPQWDLACACEEAFLCSCNEAELHKSPASAGNDSGKGNG